MTNTNVKAGVVRVSRNISIIIQDSHQSIDLASASVDQLYSARRLAWLEVFSSLAPKNQVGQKYSSGWQSYSAIKEYKQKLIDSRGIPEVEQELVSRGLDPKSKNYTRVSARIEVV